MAEEIQSLIEKIQQDGINVAEEKAKEIEDQAKKQADLIQENARVESERLLSEAKDNLAKMEQSQKALLAQAGRDLMLTLKKEINAMLERLILQEIQESITPEVMADILGRIIKEQATLGKEDIIVTLKKEDLNKLETNFLARLKEEVKKGIILKPSEEVRSGFLISFDNAKSYFDFSDQALSEYIGTYLKPKLAELLKNALKG
jgi:V/A-type H+-transporting ATPase subunit E